MTQKQAIFVAAAAFFVWVLSDTAIKFASKVPFSPFLVMAVFGIVGCTSLAGSAFFKRNMSALKPNSLKEQALSAFCAAGINYANVVAFKHLPLTRFYVVVFTTPLVVAALSALLKQEKPTPAKIGCIMAGFLGTALAIGIGESGGDWVGYFAAATTVFSFALSTILMRKMARTDTVESIQFIKALAVAAIGLIGVFVYAPTLPAPWVLGIILLSGLFGLGGNLLHNIALQNTTSTTVSQFHYTQIIYGALFGYLLWNELPTWNLVLGSIIIIASGMTIAAQVKRAH